MEKDDQITLVNQLCMGMALKIDNAIENGYIPSTWDGHELRCLIADAAKCQAARTVIRKQPRSQRTKDYKNTLRITSI